MLFLMMLNVTVADRPPRSDRHEACSHLRLSFMQWCRLRRVIDSRIESRSNRLWPAINHHKQVLTERLFAEHLTTFTHSLALMYAVRHTFGMRKVV